MRIRHTVGAPGFEDIVDKVLSSKWIPFAAGVVATVVVVHVSANKQPIIIVNS